jgi:hypothetical protein
MYVSSPAVLTPLHMENSGFILALGSTIAISAIIQGLVRCPLDRPMNLDHAELWRLRRFALASGLVLVVWALAGVSIGAEPQLNVVGLPLVVARADLLPIGLAIATCYAALRYFYYAVSYGPSPYRTRRDLLDKFRGRPSPRTHGGYPTPGTYLGKLYDIEASPSTDDRGQMEKLASDVSNAFPKFGFARVVANVKGEPSYTNDGESYISYTVEATIPVRCRLAAIVQDVDYTAPVWFPIACTAFWLSRG